jgi:protein involved in polysaccharide export with SLBB domain
MSPRPSSIASALSPACGWASSGRALAAGFVVLACALAGCQADPKPSTTARASAPPDLSAYRLGIGDRVRVSVFGEPDLSVDGDIDATGHLGYPLLGQVPAVRRTADELARDIANGLSSGFLVNPDVRVAVIQYRPIYLTGQVNRPGAYPFTVGLTVEKAVALAGGLTRIASERGIFRLHEDAPASERRRVKMDDPVLPGDTLVVEESLF